MIDRKIKAYSDTVQTTIEGRCALIFNDALASGTKDYTPMTYLLVEDSTGKIHVVKPRNVIKFLDV